MLEDYCSHIRQMLKHLREAGIEVDVNKYKLYIQETNFLGLIISTESIWIDLQKVSIIFDWAQPTSLRHVRLFLGFCVFYQRFIRDFLKLAKPLTSFTKKNTPFDWSSAC